MTSHFIVPLRRGIRKNDVKRQAVRAEKRLSRTIYSSPKRRGVLRRFFLITGSPSQTPNLGGCYETGGEDFKTKLVAGRSGGEGPALPYGIALTFPAWSPPW
jgi:hypothetical protein